MRLIGEECFWTMKMRSDCWWESVQLNTVQAEHCAGSWTAGPKERHDTLHQHTQVCESLFALTELGVFSKVNLHFWLIVCMYKENIAPERKYKGNMFYKCLSGAVVSRSHYESPGLRSISDEGSRHTAHSAVDPSKWVPRETWVKFLLKL